MTSGGLESRLASLTPAEKRALLAQALARSAAQPRRYPVSYIQQRIWFLERFSPGDPVYHMALAARLTGPLRLDVLQSALDDLVARQAALRTTFGEDDGEPFQVVAPAGSLPLSIVDVAGPDELDRRLDQQVRVPFDLATGPLIRAHAYRLSDEDCVLFLTVHHIVFDALSIGVLFRDLTELYRARSEGTPPELPAMPVTYGDYAVWQRDQLRGPALTRLLHYWTDRLDGAPPLLELPTERRRPEMQTFNGGQERVRLAPELEEAFTQLARDARVTPFTVALALFVLVLHRFTGQDDIVVGTPVAGRGQAEIEPLVGVFVNTLVLRTSLAGDPTFRQLLGRVQETTLGALSHQDLPFEKLVEALSPERAPDRSPIFQVQLVYQNEAVAAPSFAGVTIRAVREVYTHTAKLDLALFVEPWPTGTELGVEYNSDLFDAAWARRFLDCLQTALGEVTARPDARIGDLALLADAERDRVLRAPNATARPVPATSALDLLGREATVSAGDRTLTAAELADWSARVARALADAGVTRGTVVGLCVDRSVDLLAGLLGVWRAGAAYVPLDPGFPRMRLRQMVAEARVRVVVTQDALRGLVGDMLDSARMTGVQIICVDGPQVASAPPAPPAVRLTADDLAYVIFTSGSTGRPKGVAVPHGAVANLLSSFVDDPGLRPDDRFVAVTTLSFDIALLELLLPLATGAHLTLASRADAADPVALHALLAERGATAMQATPATWRMLLGTGELPAHLRLRLCGGEALPRDLATALQVDGAQLWNVYGPTETTVWSAAGRVPPAPAPITIGPPVANTQVYVLDDRLRPVPVGVAGEVYLGGRGLARGYHRRPGLTAERFLPHPYGDPGTRLYRTGDVGRWRTDLSLDLLGRADQQVKIRGFRIETGEIEAALRTHPAVRQAVCHAVTVESDTRLVAYVVPEPTDATAAVLWPDVSAHLRGRLPEYLVPATLVTLAALPMTPNGKVDRKALPPPQWGATSTVEFVAPRTPVERAIAAIWTELLGRTEAVGVHDDFFALGGHSLSATQMVARIRAALGVNLRLRYLFAGPTVAQIAATVEADPAYRPPEA